MTKIVCIDHASLQDGSDLSEAIQTAFGADGLGIILIRGVEGLSGLRLRLLKLAHALAYLPDKATIEDTTSNFSFGWSHGKEKLEDGRLDTHKGSFYANPCLDDPSGGDLCLSNSHPAYLRPNLWPTSSLPQLEPAFKNLGQLIVNVGAELVGHCDLYTSTACGFDRGCLIDSISSSKNHKARLLYYFPPVPSDTSEAWEGHHWCGWHLDHGSITGLTSAIYFNEAGEEVPNPDPSAGLYIRDRSGSVVKALIPADCLAFQMGEGEICGNESRFEFPLTLLVLQHFKSAQATSCRQPHIMFDLVLPHFLSREPHSRYSSNLLMTSLSLHHLVHQLFLAGLDLNKHFQNSPMQDSSSITMRSSMIKVVWSLRVQIGAVSESRQTCFCSGLLRPVYKC